MRFVTPALIRIISFALTILSLVWILDQQLSPLLNLLCIIGGLFVVFPVVWIGRKLLDLDPTIERTMWITTVVHVILMILFFVAIIKAIQTGPNWRGWVIPIPNSIGMALFGVTGAATLLTVANLALRGLGAPFAIALSRRLATNWLYAWTRNPMVFSLLACLVAVGLWLQSTLFVVWVLFLVTPAWVVFLKVYEERELELRFGETYLEYKAKTPFLWPKKPKV